MTGISYVAVRAMMLYQNAAKPLSLPAMSLPAISLVRRHVFRFK
jgi:hypothetical protein